MATLPTTNGMPSKDDVAKGLAESHRNIDPGITHIYRIVVSPDMEADAAEPIKLLEVNRNSTVSGIVPVLFSPEPARGVVYPTTIVEIHPSEWDQLRKGMISLPDGWRLDQPL